MPEVKRVAADEPEGSGELGLAGLPGNSGLSGDSGLSGFSGSSALLSSLSLLEASSYLSKTDAAAATWQLIPHFGACQDGIALFPYTKPTDGASITYAFQLAQDQAKARATLILAPTFPFNDGRGQRLRILLDGQELATLNVNEASRYIVNAYHDQNYHWETTRMNAQTLSLPSLSAGTHQLTLCPLDPGIVLERILVDSE